MTAQPDMTRFGQPPAPPSGMRRIAPFIATAATGGLFMMLGIGVLQLTLPEHLKPGYILGSFVGSETKGQIETSGDAQIGFETRQQAAQQALATTTQAMTGAADIANTADQLCGWSRIGQGVAGQMRPSGYVARQDSLAEMAFEFLGVVGSASCGVGTEIRNGIIGEVTGNGRRSGTLSVRELQALPADQLKNVQQAFAIEHSSRHYSDQEFGEAKAIYLRQPPEVQNALTAGLRADYLTSQDTFIERTFTYARVVKIQ